MSQLLTLVNLLLSFGPKIPAAMEIVQRVIKDFQDLYDLLQPRRSESAPVALTADEQAGVDKLAAAMGHGGSERGGFLQNIIALLQSHPEWVAALVAIFSKIVL